MTWDIWSVLHSAGIALAVAMASGVAAINRLCNDLEQMNRRSNQGAAANRHPAGQSDGTDNLSATVAADRAFPAAVAELGRPVTSMPEPLNFLSRLELAVAAEASCIVTHNTRHFQQAERFGVRALAPAAFLRSVG